MNKNAYRFIIEAEMAILMNYKIDPYALFQHLSVSDLNLYMEILQHRLEDQRKNNSGKDLGKALLAIRDILNFMYA